MNDEIDSSEQAAQRAQIFEKTFHFLSIERADLAEQQVLKALTADPEESDLHYLLAVVHYDQDRNGSAREHAERALELDPESDYTFTLLGQISKREGKNQDAERYYLEALRLDPTCEHTLLQYGVLMEATGNTKKAEELVRLSLEYEPENKNAHAVLASILSDRDKEGSKAAAAQGARIDPNAAITHFTTANDHFASGRPFKARYHAREALRLDPGDEDFREWYQHLDLHSRWTALPYYYWSLVLEKIPGAQFTVWGAFVLFITSHESLGVDPQRAGTIAAGYLFFAIYTWIAIPITKLWIRLRPAR